ncbi:MAG: hypothetical protein RL660_1163 [Bacteroidota bacterium]|jgi:photosystem II stability/assembly factor-like uncharacterized protein
MKRYLLFFILLTITQLANAQKLGKSYLPPLEPSAPAWIKMLYQDSINAFDLENAYEAYYTENPFEKNTYTQYYKRWKYENEKHLNEDGWAVKPQPVQQVSTRDTRSANSEWNVVGPLETFVYAGSNVAQPATPTQVNIYAFDIAASNPNIMYAAPESGGLFKTTNKGLDWVSVSDSSILPNLTAVAIDPTNPNIVYVGGYEYIYKTIDGGATWTQLLYLSGLGTTDIAIVPSTPTKIFHSGDLGLRVSTNSGATWTVVSGMSAAAYDIEINSQNNSSIYVLRNNAAGTQSEFWKSHNMGTSFTAVSNGWITGTGGIGRLAITPADTNRIYAVLLMNSPTAAPAIMRSNDGGNTWATAVQSTVTGLAGNTSLPLGMSNGQGFYDLSIMVSTTNADHVIVGTTTIYKSVDGADTFTALGGYHGSFDLHPDVQDMHMRGNDAWISTDGGMIYSTDFFTSTSNYFTRQKGIYGSAYWGMGQGWNEDILCGGRYHNGNAALYENYPAGKSILLGGAESGTGYVLLGKTRRVAHSDIGGRIIPSTFTATDMRSFTLGKYPNEDDYGFNAGEMEFYPSCYNHIYITKDSSLWKSTDGGNSYTEVYRFTHRTKKFEISRSTPGTMYLATTSKLYKTTDSGTTWTPITLPTGTSIFKLAIALSFTDANTFWITSTNNPSGNRVFKTTDGGATFTNLTSPAINAHKYYTIVHQAGTDGGVYIFAQNTGKVFYTNNSLGTAWVDFSKKLPVGFDPVSAKPFYRDSKLRTAGTRGIWEIDFYEEAQAPIAQPTVDKLVSYCLKDTFLFDDFSMLNHSGATWSWNIPQANYISSTSVRNPKVLFSALGTYTATLTVTNGSGVSSSKSITVQVADNECAIDTIPGGALQIASSSNSLASAEALSLPNTNTFTMMAWVKANSAQADYAGILSFEGGAHLNLRAANSADSSEIGYHHPNGAWWYSSGLYLKKDEWTHVAMVVEPTKITVYKNGVPSVHTNLTVQALSFGPKFLVGSMATREYDRCFKGKIDEVAVYNAALSTNEIREMMHLTKQNPNYPAQANANLKAYYQFNETNSNVCYDNVGVAHLNYQNSTNAPSSAPIGGGVSHRIAGINSAGLRSFTGTSVDMDFATGTYPNGDVVVSMLNVAPDVQPGAFPIHQKYFIANNYGTNQTVTALNKIVFNQLATYVPGVTTDFELYKRKATADGNTWGNVQDIADAYNVNGGNSSLEFSTNNNITSFGQFCLSSKTNVAPLSIATATGLDNFVVYPNPARQHCYIGFTNSNASDFCYVHMIDALGQTILSQPIAIKAGANRLMLPLPQLASGVYTVQVNLGNAREQRQLVIE